MTEYTLIIPYYDQPEMLARQMAEVEKYPDGVKVIVVDDGSPNYPAGNLPVTLFRIDEDIPWNREQARNIGAYMCETEWMVQVDIDHILPAESAAALLEYTPTRWARFPRWRVGAADETRKKDKIHHRKKFGQIHPHIDSYLISREQFMASPYDERYAGCLGGGTPFLERQKQLYGEPALLPEEICLHVYTSHEVSDSSIATLSRDKAEYQRRRAEICDAKPETILHHPWRIVQ